MSGVNNEWAEMGDPPFPSSHNFFIQGGRREIPVYVSKICEAEVLEYVARFAVLLHRKALGNIN